MSIKLHVEVIYPKMLSGLSQESSGFQSKENISEKCQTEDSSTSENSGQNSEKSTGCKDLLENIRAKKTSLRRSLRNSISIPKGNSILNYKSMSPASTQKSLEVSSDSQNIYSGSNCGHDQIVDQPQEVYVPKGQELMTQFKEKYRMLQKVGQGAHSIVFKCQNILNGRIYALKKITSIREEQESKLHRVFRTHKLLRHPNLLKFEDYAYDPIKHTVLMVMELCQVPNLKELFMERLKNRQKFSSSEILTILSRMSDVILYLHSEGICHRDIKPENILFCPKSHQLKLIDFDICSLKEKECSRFQMWTNTGTMAYRAPEMFKIGYDEKIDIWGMGVTVYELLTGENPFSSLYEIQLIEKIQKLEPKFSGLRTSKKIKLLLKRCLEKDPSSRASAEQICAFLKGHSKVDFDLSTKRKSYKETQHVKEAESKKPPLGVIAKHIL